MARVAIHKKAKKTGAAARKPPRTASKKAGKATKKQSSQKKKKKQARAKLRRIHLESAAGSGQKYFSNSCRMRGNVK